jgi:phytoene dehydrogenase-like protein
MTVIIIGAGHNGLAAAFYLAKAGFKPLVLEQRDAVGGGAITGDLHPGFRCPTLAHHTSIWADVVWEMDLPRHGLEFLTPGVEVFAPGLDGPPLIVYDDERRTAEGMRPLSTKDADSYPAYRSAIQQVSTVVASLLTSPAPRIDDPDAGDLWNLLKTGRKFQRLGKRNAYRLLRWTPMPVADLVREWFESELLCASLAAPGLSGTMFGPRSAGSGLVLLLQEANRLLARRSCRVRGGPGALTHAMAAAARAAGAEIRTATRVERIVVTNERVSGVVANGREIPAAAVVSAVDPKTTFLRLMDPVDLTPDFLLKIRNYRSAGTVAKVNLALAALPAFRGPAEATGPAEAGPYLRHGVHHGVRHGAAHAELLSGRIHIGPSIDYLERAFDHAKYGELPAEPWLDVTIPSILDPELAPRGAHVMSIYVHYAPYRLRGQDWREARGDLLKRVMATLERFAPGLGALVVATQVITPLELETDYGFHGGHIFHGELALDQLATMRPLLGYSRYHGPVRGLYLCSAGTHPGGFMTGASGKLAAREIARGA